MQSNNDQCAVNRKIKGRLRKVKKHVKKDSHFPVSHQDIDLETPNSLLVHADLKLLINQQTFDSLSSDRQARVMRLLPICDQVLGFKNNLRLTEALNNEFFTKACNDWKLKLSEGEFTPEGLALANMENHKELSRIDPWKLKHYEPFWVEEDPICKSFTQIDYSLSPYNDNDFENQSNQLSSDPTSAILSNVPSTCDDMTSLVTSNGLAMCDHLTSIATCNVSSTCDNVTSIIRSNVVASSDETTLPVTSDGPASCDDVTSVFKYDLSPTFNDMTSLITSNVLPACDEAASLVNVNTPLTCNDKTSLVTSNVLPACDDVTSVVNVNAPPTYNDMASLITSNVLPACDEAASLVNVNAPPTCNDMTSLVTSNVLPACDDVTSVVNVNAPPTYNDMASLITSNALVSCDGMTSVITCTALSSCDGMTADMPSSRNPVTDLFTSNAFLMPRTCDDPLVSTCNGVPSVGVDTSRILSALLSSLRNPALMVSTGISARSCTPSLSSINMPSSSQTFTLKSSSSEMNLAAAVVTSCKLPGLLPSNGLLFTSPPSICSRSSPDCHSLVARSAHPMAPVVLLPMPFLNSGSVPVLSNLPMVVKSSSMPFVHHTADRIRTGENGVASMSPSSMRPSVFQIRVPMPGQSTGTDCMRKRLLDCVSMSELKPPEAKRPLLTLPTFPRITAPGIDVIGVESSSSVPFAARLVSMSQSVSSLPGTNESVVRSKPAVSTMNSAATTTLFSIPIQGMSGRAPCPVMFMVPAAAPRTNTALSRPPASSAFFYMINSPRPSFSNVPSGNPPVPVFNPVCADKSEPNVRPSSLMLPQFNGARVSTNVTNSTMPMLFNGAVRMIQTPKNQRPLYVVSLPNATPCTQSAWSAGSVSLHNAGVIRTELVASTSNQVCDSLPQQFVPKGDGPDIRFFPSVPVATSSQPPQFVGRLIAESLASRASSMFTTGISPSFRAGIPSSIIGSHSTASSLQSFQHQVNSFVPVPPQMANSTTSSILQNLLSRSIPPSMETISRSLSHLYAVNSPPSSSSSVAASAANRSLSHLYAVISPNSSSSVAASAASRSLEAVNVNGLSRPSITDASSAGNKCGKCGAPCLLADRVGQYKLCITCLIMA